MLAVFPPSVTMNEPFGIADAEKPAAGTITWRRRTVPLKVCIGDLTVWSPPLDLLLAETAFANLPETIDLASLPPLDPELEGYLIRSCPADGESWRIRRMAEHLLYAPRRYQRHWTALEGSFDDYLAKLSGKTRTTLRRKVKKFDQAAGGRDVRVYKTPAEMDIFHKLARDISEKSYQERLMAAGLPTDQGFLQEMQVRAADDRVRGYLLFHQGVPVAYTYGPVDDGVVIYDHTGFDPAYRALSPGTVLQFLTLESLFAEGRFRRFDFTEGEGAHKALFGTHSQDCMDLYILRKRPRVFGAVMVQTVIERGTEMLAAGLEQVGVKRYLKRVLRRV